MYTVYHESFEAEKFRGFRGFLVLRETFFHENISILLKSGRLYSYNYGNPRKFFREDLCDALTVKVFCLKTFMVYTVCISICRHFVTFCSTVY